MKITLFLLFITAAASGWGQILTFDFAGIAGNETAVNSNTNNPGITASSITRGAGLTASTNADRFNATGWATASIANAIAGNDFMEFTITPAATCIFSVSSISIQLQRSGTGPSAIVLRSSLDSFAANLDAEYSIVDNTSTQTFTFSFTQSNISTATTYRFYMYAEAAGGSGGIGDGAGNDLIVNGTTNCSASPELNLQTSATSRACGYTHNFGSISTSNSSSVPLTIQNTGTADITINSLALSGSADYTLSTPPA
ncbi:MAG: hypothetical protein K9G40_06715, partial [Crocinitomicaceae bacterium]|nr:hypothetical protein [Crocinitomicaceae bacterium]